MRAVYCMRGKANNSNQAMTCCFQPVLFLSTCLSLGEQWARGEGPHTPDPVVHCSVVFGTPVDVFLVLHQVSVGIDAGIIWDTEREQTRQSTPHPRLPSQTQTAPHPSSSSMQRSSTFRLQNGCAQPVACRQGAGARGCKGVWEACKGRVSGKVSTRGGGGWFPGVLFSGLTSSLRTCKVPPVRSRPA